MASYFTGLFMFFGSLLVLTAGIGIVRLPDTLARSHALSKALTLGVSLVLLALLIHLSKPLAVLKVLAALAFNFVTLPLAGHIFALYASRQPRSGD